MTMKTIKLFSYLLITGTLLINTSCSSDDNNSITETEATCTDGIQNGGETGIDCGGTSCTPCEVEGQRIFTIGAEVEDGDEVFAYVDTLEDLTSGSLTFIDNGLELPATIASRVLGVGDDYIYALDYGGGKITQYEIDRENGGYKSNPKELNIQSSIGTAFPRWKEIDDNTIMLHNVEVVYEYEDDGVTIKSVTPTMKVIAIQIPEFTIKTVMEDWIIPQTEEDIAESAYGFRVDAPVVSNGKLYYGLMRTVNGIGRGGVPASGMETVVMDFPSLTNQTVIRYDDATGHTNGYRTPSMHVDEDGDVYQSNLFSSLFSFDLSEGDKTVITRLKNGTYDSSYTFNVSEALGENISTAGWFYAGNGIGYMPIIIEDVLAVSSREERNYWSVAKIDLVNKTAVKLNVPLSYLLEYQSSVTIDDSFFMAISPDGGDSYIYEFDMTSTSPDAFTTGTQFDGGNVSIQGIY